MIISRSRAQSSTARARAEVSEHYGATTWQRHGHRSLFGTIFAIAYEMGKVLDYTVKSQHCAGCKYWEKNDKTL